MNGLDDSSGAFRETAGDEEFVARLLRTAGTRVEPPPEDYDRVYSAASIALERMLQGRRRRTRWQPLAIAASVLVALGGLILLMRPSPAPPVVAQTLRLVGDVRLRPADQFAELEVPVGTRIAAGSEVHTRDQGRLALRLANGAQLRIDTNSSVRLESGHTVRLLRGAVYVDSGSRASKRESLPVEIVTDVTRAREIGTRFEVRLSGTVYRLRVRDGRVDLDHRSRAYAGGPGEQLLIDADGTVKRSRVVLDDPDWAWIEAITVAPGIENQPLSRVLAWVTRETGRPIRFGSTELERRASDAILHGNIDGLAPLDALATVLASSGLRYQIDADGSILILAD
jgi:ferric-dicitrate binding protein FerR (iron transport regulator)